jgi:hypothetical protein
MAFAGIWETLNMIIIGYQFDPLKRFVDIILNNGLAIRVMFNSHTGLIYTRKKKDPYYQNFIQHKGLYVGTWGNKQIIIHNHIDAGTAELVTYEQFSKGIQVYVDNKECTNNPITRVKIALHDAHLNKPYNLLNNNCQTLTNKACNNVRRSDDFPKVVLGGLVFASVFALIGAALSAND